MTAFQLVVKRECKQAQVENLSGGSKLFVPFPSSTYY